jgi:hypothetical protein
MTHPVCLRAGVGKEGTEVSKMRKLIILCVVVLTMMLVAVPPALAQGYYWNPACLATPPPGPHQQLDIMIGGNLVVGIGAVGMAGSTGAGALGTDGIWCGASHTALTTDTPARAEVDAV